MAHFCELQNELGQMAIIDGSSAVWIYDSSSDFLGNFEIDFCPKCGMQLKPDPDKPDGELCLK